MQIIKQQNKIAVLIGRFQPFHIGHEDLIHHISRRFDKFILFLGDMKEDDLFTVEERRIFFQHYLKDKFKQYWIRNVNDTSDDLGFVMDVIVEIMNIVDCESDISIIKTIKYKEIRDGYHYLNLFDDKGFNTLVMTPSSISSSDIREFPELCKHLIYPPLMEESLKKIKEKNK